jgi:hypothetical protein
VYKHFAPEFSPAHFEKNLVCPVMIEKKNPWLAPG